MIYPQIFYYHARHAHICESKLKKNKKRINPCCDWFYYYRAWT